MKFKFSIGVTTYLARFERYFIPLMRNLIKIFPDYDIIVFLNGHYKLPQQIRFMQEATAFLAQYPNVRYLTNITHQPLARAWNWLIMMAVCEYILILNDDLAMNSEFRHNLERLGSVPDIFTINRSWSHFVIRKKVIEQAGWFDERLIGIGYEDYDYIFRLARHGLVVKNVTVHGILNYVAPSTDASWADMSGVTMGKYSQANHDYFVSKWAWSDYEEVPEKGAFQVTYEPYDQKWQVALKKPLNGGQVNYPRESLTNTPGPALTLLSRLRGRVAQVRSFTNSFFWTTRLAVAAHLRRLGLLGPWWKKLKAGFTK